MKLSVGRVIGVIMAATLVIPIVVSLVVSVPDIIRYFRIRSM